MQQPQQQQNQRGGLPTIYPAPVKPYKSQQGRQLHQHPAPAITDNWPPAWALRVAIGRIYFQQQHKTDGCGDKHASQQGVKPTQPKHQSPKYRLSSDKTLRRGVGAGALLLALLALFPLAALAALAALLALFPLVALAARRCSRRSAKRARRASRSASAALSAAGAAASGAAAGAGKAGAVAACAAAAETDGNPGACCVCAADTGGKAGA